MQEHDIQADIDTAKTKTLYDRIYEYALQSEKPLPVRAIQSAFGLDDGGLREMLDVFTNARVFEVRQDIIIKVTQPYGLVSYGTIEGGTVLEESPFEWKSLRFQIKILKLEDETVPIYYIPPIRIGMGLRTRLRSIFYNLTRTQGTKKVSIDRDSERPMDISKQLAMAAIEREMKARPELSDRLSDIMIFEFAEVGCLNIFLADRDIEEIVFNGDNNAVSVYSSKYGWMKTNVDPNGEGSLLELAGRMARLVQKEVNFSNPIVETRLPSGDRVSTILGNISPQGTVITIRKFFRNPWTIVGLVKTLNTMNVDIAALLWFAVEYDLNVLVAGGSGSGKTTLLNAICNLIPPSLHVLSIETVREIYIPRSRAWNWLSLVSRDEVNQEHLDTANLISVSLKMRPERIVLGEAVRQEDIRSLFQSMQIGHPVYSTMHATSSNELLLRVMDPAYQIPRTDINSIDLVLVMYHNLKEKTRVVQEVSEISYDSSTADRGHVNILYTYSQKNKTHVQASKPKKLFEKVQQRTGMNEADILRDIEEKKTVIEWAIEKDIVDIRKFEKVVQEYYTQRKRLLAEIEAAKGRQKR